MYKNRLQNKQRDITPKLRKGEQLFLCKTHYLNLICIAIKSHHDIQKPNTVTESTKVALQTATVNILERA